jgi:leucyl aminopeptidase (aminopeptidase T)
MVDDYLAVRERENVLVTADTASDMVAAEAILAASEAAGAKATLAIIPQLPFQGTLADPYIPEPLAGAAQSCDVWIDLCFPYLAGSTVSDQALKAGRVRYLMITGMSGAGIDRLFAGADQDLIYAVQTGLSDVIQASEGKEARITTHVGTDLSFMMAKHSRKKPRRYDKPGMYTPPGSVAFSPELESVRGTVVITSVFHEYYVPRLEPITIKVDGQITEISGGGSELYPMERSLRRAGGGEYGHIIHFTHGFHPAVRPGQGLLEDIRTPGNNAIGLGKPFWVPGGGENHPDGLINMHSVWIDGEVIVKDGDIVSPPELAKLAKELTHQFQPGTTMPSE